MISYALFLALTTTAPNSPNVASDWVPYTSNDGKFVVDFPGKPSRTFTRQSKSRYGTAKYVVAQCNTPEMLYTAQKIEFSGGAGLKNSDLEAILDFFRDDLVNEFNGKIVTQKKLRLDAGSLGRDFTIEGRPDPKGGLATIRVREYMSQKVLYMLIASTDVDRDLPDDVGHFFASFSPGTNRTKNFEPRPEVAGKKLGAWGMAIDPDKDCKIEDKAKALVISIPNTHHDLNADNDKLNAPRVVRDVTGDFSMTVKVSGDFKPSAKSTNPKAVPYIGAGILVWQDSNNYVFLGRAAIYRSNKISEMAAFEEREWGTRGALNNKGIEPGGIYLRLVRQNNRLLGYTSKDGKTWARLDPMETSYPATIKVGLYAINGCSDPVSMRFEDFKFTQEKSGSAKKKSR